MSAGDTSTIRISAGVPEGATVRPATTMSALRWARTIWPAFEPFDEIGSSSTNSSVESYGKTLPAAGTDGLGVAFGMGVGGIGYAPAVPTPTVTKAKMRRLRLTPSRARLTRALLAVGGCALSLFDELLDLLPTFLSDTFVEVGAITIPRGFAALFPTLFADMLVELVAVG